MKQCITCNILREISEFDKRKNRKNPDGECKVCRRKRQNSSGRKQIYVYKYVKRPHGYYYKYELRKREKVKKQYGFGAGSLYRYGLKKLLEVYGKYNYECSVCLSKTNLTIHHIDGRGYKNRKKFGINNDIENLQLVCRKCHGSFHGKENKQPKKREKGVIFLPKSFV